MGKLSASSCRHPRRWPSERCGCATGSCREQKKSHCKFWCPYKRDGSKFHGWAWTWFSPTITFRRRCPPEMSPKMEFQPRPRGGMQGVNAGLRRMIRGLTAATSNPGEHLTVRWSSGALASSLWIKKNRALIPLSFSALAVANCYILPLLVVERRQRSVSCPCLVVPAAAAPRKSVPSTFSGCCVGPAETRTPSPETRPPDPSREGKRFLLWFLRAHVPTIVTRRRLGFTQFS
jgi:hypothetical protein